MSEALERRRAERARTASQDRRIRCVLVLMIVAVACGVAVNATMTVAVIHNTRDIATIERADLLRTRGALYRICARANATRAGLQVTATVIDFTGARTRRREIRAPILDCSPNLLGGVAKGLSPRHQRQFVKRFIAKGELPTVCAGEIYRAAVRCVARHGRLLPAR